LKRGLILDLGYERLRQPSAMATPALRNATTA